MNDRTMYDSMTPDARATASRTGPGNTVARHLACAGCEDVGERPTVEQSRPVPLYGPPMRRSAYGPMSPQEERAFTRYYTPRVLERARQQMSYRMIAADLGIDRRRVARICKAHGFEGGHNRLMLSGQRRTTSDRDVERMIALYTKYLRTTVEIAAMFGRAKSSVRDILAREIPLRDRSRARMVAANNPNAPKGCARLELIRRIVDMRSGERWPWKVIADRAGLSVGMAWYLYATPYARARRRMMYGDIPATRAERETLALAMYDRQALPADFIARVVDVPVQIVEEWIDPRPRAKARKRADQRVIRAECAPDTRHGIGVLRPSIPDARCALARDCQ